MRLKKSDVNEEEVRNDLKDLLYKVPSIHYVSKILDREDSENEHTGIFDHFFIHLSIHTQEWQWSQNKQRS